MGGTKPKRKKWEAGHRTCATGRVAWARKLPTPRSTGSWTVSQKVGFTGPPKSCGPRRNARDAGALGGFLPARDLMKTSGKWVSGAQMCIHGRFQSERSRRIEHQIRGKKTERTRSVPIAARTCKPLIGQRWGERGAKTVCRPHPEGRDSCTAFRSFLKISHRLASHVRSGGVSAWGDTENQRFIKQIRGWVWGEACEVGDTSGGESNLQGAGRPQRPKFNLIEGRVRQFLERARPTKKDHRP